MRRTLAALVSLSVLVALGAPPAVSAVSSVAETKIVNPAASATYGDSRAHFGSRGAVAADLTRVAVGASGYGPQAGQGNNADAIGRVYLFKCDTAAGCVQETILAPSDGAKFWRFGWSVDVSGDTVVVGTMSLGKVYIYDLVGSSWAETILQPAGASTAFGYSVAIDGDRIVIGDKDSEGLDGSVYVYERSGGGWQQADRLTYAEPDTNGALGFSVSVQDDTIAVGQVGSDAVVIFENDGKAGWDAQRVISPDGYGGGWTMFGQSVAVDGDRIFAGDGRVGIAGTGEIFILERRSNGTWRYLERVAPPGGGGNFGYDIDAGFRRVVVSDPNNALWIGEPSLMGWQWEQIVATDLVADEDFPGGAALAWELAVGGAPVKSLVTGVSAAVYVYRLCEGMPITLRGTDGNDTLNGTAGNDVIYLFKGDDTSDGGAGKDRICGGGGNDLIMGGDDPDRLRGGWGNDEMYGGKGSDKLRGAQGDDELIGDEHDDQLWGSVGDDTMLGGKGDDLIRGGAGTDIADGDGGDDNCKAETQANC